MVERKVKGRYLVAFLLTASIFVLGIFLGMIMSDYKTTKIYNSERDLMSTFLVHNLQTDLLITDPCGLSNNSLVSQEIFKVGDRLSALENDLGKKDPQVISLKKYYTLLEIKDYLYYKNLNEKCKTNFVLNLFFYSNDPKKCEKCEDQGFVLSYVRLKNQNIRTYSFDVDLGVSILDYLVKHYNITELPSVVFNEKTHKGFLDRADVEEMLNEH